MIRNYIKIALRNLLKYRQFSLLNILGLSLAIAVAVCMFLYVEDELSYDLKHSNAQQKHRITMKTQFGENDFHSAWTPAFLGARVAKDLSEVQSYATLYKHFKGYAIEKDQEEFAINDVYYATPNFFTFFAFKLKYGNPELALSNPDNIVLHENLVAKLYPGESVIGKTIETSNGTKKITGVMIDSRENNHFSPQVVSSIIGQWNIKELSNGVNFDASFYNYIELTKGSSINNKKLNSLAPSYFQEWANADENRRNEFKGQQFEMQMQAIKDIHLNSNLEFEMEANGTKSIVIIFSFVAIIILLVASINYMNLATARYMERMKELGIRKVLGSRRTQLSFQYFTESVTTVVISAFVGFVLVQLTLPFFNSIAGKSMEFSQLYQLKTWLFLMIIIVGCAFISSIYPSLVISGLKPVQIFSKNSLGRNSGNRFRKSMLVFQITSSGILLIFTFVIFNQLQFMRNTSLGFEQDKVIIVEVKAREARSKIPVLKEEMMKISYVTEVGLTGQIPGDENLKTEPMGFETNEESFNDILTNYIFAGPDLVKVLDLKITQGSNFDATKGGANRGQEVIVNSAMVEAMNWNNPIGKKVKLPIGDAKVVGVIEDFHLKSMHHKIEPLTIIYLDNWAEALLIKTTATDIPQTVKAIEKIYSRVMGDAAFNYSFLDQRFALQYKSDQQKVQLFMIFSLLTITIACLGLIGMMGFSLARRSKEIGIRRVFGANSFAVIYLFSKEYGCVILIGIIIAIPVANYLIKDWLVNFPYRLNLSAIYFIIPTGSLLLISTILIFLSAYKASKTNPANVLRSE